MDDHLLTVRDVADRLQVARSTVLRWVASGSLPAIRMPSGALRFSESGLEAWLANRQTGDGE